MTDREQAVPGRPGPPVANNQGGGGEVLTDDDRAAWDALDAAKLAWDRLTGGADAVGLLCAEVDRLRAELAAAPTWATTPPTAEGWYWLRMVGPTAAIGGQVVCVGRDRHGRLGVELTEAGDGEFVVLDRYDGYEWAGPIPEPRGPR